jgi:hypothetical protein
LVQKSRRLGCSRSHGNDDHTQSISRDGGLAQGLVYFGGKRLCRLQAPET